VQTFRSSRKADVSIKIIAVNTLCLYDNNIIVMALSNYMNITFQIWNGPKHSILLRQDFTMTDFIMAVNNSGICVEDYIFIARGKKLNLEDEVEFNSQNGLFADTYIQVTAKPKVMNGFNVLLANKK